MNTNKKIKVSIVGATGYAGAELVRILCLHPYTEIVALSSVSYEGKLFSEIYPNFKNIVDLVLVTADEAIDAADVVFASLPHGLSEPIAEKCLADGKLLIDLGADYRMHDEATYANWYKRQYSHPETHAEACYCLPELFPSNIKKAKVIANPGCYPTSVALGVAPALLGGFIETSGIIIDSKSGVSGAGRGLSQNTHYPDTNEAFAAYNIGGHRHTPEIEQTLSDLIGEPITLTFTPHLLPVNRGIESTIYMTLKPGVDADKIYDEYKKFYADKQFVRIENLGSYANIKNVRYSNYCDISIHFDLRNNRLIVCSVIDNMVKGAAGQAVQNLNLYYDFPESTALTIVPQQF